MTRNEARVLKFVKDFLSMYGFSPSYKEIAESLNLSQKAIEKRIGQALSNLKKNLNNL